MSELAVSIGVGLATLAFVALGWRAANTRRLLLVVAILVNLGMAQAVADQARLVSWSVSGTLILAGLLTSRREHWRNVALPLLGLAVALLAASYFATDAPAGVQRGLLIALGVTTGLALLSSLITVIRLMRADLTQRT